MNLIREMLIGTADALGPMDCSAFVDERHDFACVVEHARMMDEAGLVETSLFREMNGAIVRARIDRITWDGNEFLDAVSNDTVWHKVRKKIAQTAGSVTFEIVKSLAVTEVSANLLPKGMP